MWSDLSRIYSQMFFFFIHINNKQLLPHKINTNLWYVLSLSNVLYIYSLTKKPNQSITLNFTLETNLHVVLSHRACSKTIESFFNLLTTFKRFNNKFLLYDHLSVNQSDFTHNTVKYVIFIKNLMWD